MTDRELLEAAAQAAGYTLEWGDTFMISDCEVDCSDMAYVKSGQSDVDLRHWNPIDDDADALALAVRLHISLEFGPSHVYAAKGSAVAYADEESDGLMANAVRSVIVRVAASLATQPAPAGKEAP